MVYEHWSQNKLQMKSQFYFYKIIIKIHHLMNKKAKKALMAMQLLKTIKHCLIPYLTKMIIKIGGVVRVFTASPISSKHDYKS